MTEFSARVAVTGLGLIGAAGGLSTLPPGAAALLALLVVMATLGVAWLVPTPVLRIRDGTRWAGLFILVPLVPVVTARAVVVGFAFFSRL